MDIDSLFGFIHRNVVKNSSMSGHHCHSTIVVAATTITHHHHHHRYLHHHNKSYYVAMFKYHKIPLLNRTKHKRWGTINHQSIIMTIYKKTRTYTYCFDVDFQIFY